MQSLHPEPKIFYSSHSDGAMALRLWSSRQFRWDRESNDSGIQSQGGCSSQQRDKATNSQSIPRGR